MSHQNLSTYCGQKLRAFLAWTKQNNKEVQLSLTTCTDVAHGRKKPIPNMMLNHVTMAVSCNISELQQPI